MVGPCGHWTPEATWGARKGCRSSAQGSSQTHGGGKAHSFQAQPKLRVTRPQAGKRPSGKQGQHQLGEVFHLKSGFLCRSKNLLSGLRLLSQQPTKQECWRGGAESSAAVSSLFSHLAQAPPGCQRRSRWPCEEAWGMVPMPARRAALGQGPLQQIPPCSKGPVFSVEGRGCWNLETWSPSPWEGPDLKSPSPHQQGPASGRDSYAIPRWNMLPRPVTKQNSLDRHPTAPKRLRLRPTLEAEKWTKWLLWTPSLRF